MSDELEAAAELLNAYADEFAGATIGENIELTSNMQRRFSDAIRVVLAARAKREAVAVPEDCPPNIRKLIEDCVMYETDNEISQSGITDLWFDIRNQLAVLAASQQAAKPAAQQDDARDAVPLDALVCVGRAQFPQRGGNAGLSWHVVDALGNTDGFRSGTPCNKELLFVIPAQCKRAAILAAKEKGEGK